MAIREDVIYTPKEVQEYLKFSQSTMTRMLKKGLIRSARIRKMKSLMKEAGLTPPVFEADTFFSATFYRDPKYAMKFLRVGDQKSSQKILSLIRQNSGVTIDELAASLHLTDRAIKKNLAQFKKTGSLKRIGSDKGGRWEVSA